MSALYTVNSVTKEDGRIAWSIKLGGPTGSLVADVLDEADAHALAETLNTLTAERAECLQWGSS